MFRAFAITGILCGCGRLGFDAIAERGVDAPSADTAPIPLALDPGFPIVANQEVVNGLKISTPSFSVEANRLLVAVFVWGTGATDEQPLDITSGSLTWTRQVFSTFPPGSVAPGTSGDGIWTAWAADPVTTSVTASRSSTVESAVMTVAIYSFSGAAPTIGATGTHADQSGNTPLLVTLTPTASNSIVIGGFHHGTAHAIRTPDADTRWDLTDNPANAPEGHFQAVGAYTGVTIAGTPVTIGSSTAGPYSLTSAIEIVPLQ